MRTIHARRPATLLLLAAVLGACGSSSRPADARWLPGQPLRLDVSSTFTAGTVLRDAYTSSTATVAGDGTVTVTPGAGGVVLLEQDGAAATPFRWKNATVYFVMTDRFANGDPTNDARYGRQKDGGQEIGTWHGGDLAGLTANLDHIQALGATAVWISPPVEQVHGWVSGGSGDFKHHGYHGYWALDFTRLDANLGTPTELQAFVDAAHARGIRVLFDVVMNHPGYATGADLLTYLPEVFRDGTGAAFTAFDATTPTTPTYWAGWNDLVNYGSPQWASWWSGSWVRAGLGGYPVPAGSNDPLKTSLTFLPDFITEGTASVALPPLLSTAPRAKADTGATPQPGFTVRDYLVKWHTDWVRQYGVDGFRCDTAKHVELPAWRALKDAAVLALADWKVANPAKKLDDAPFWMTGEVFGHGVSKDAYYTDGGFDSLINFSFQPTLASLFQTRTSLADAAPDLEIVYSANAAAISADPAFDALTYLSSHDTQLFFEAVGRDTAKMRQAGTALLLAPGGVQIFYGDESGRVNGPTGSDPLQGTRSDMNWSTTDAAILAHWQKLGAFRKRHAAVGAGTHAKIASPAGTYAFSRKLSDGPVNDAVVVAILPL